MDTCKLNTIVQFGSSLFIGELSLNYTPVQSSNFYSYTILLPLTQNLAASDINRGGTSINSLSHSSSLVCGYQMMLIIMHTMYISIVWRRMRVCVLHFSVEQFGGLFFFKKGIYKTKSAKRSLKLDLLFHTLLFYLLWCKYLCLGKDNYSFDF